MIIQLLIQRTIRTLLAVTRRDQLRAALVISEKIVINIASHPMHFSWHRFRSPVRRSLHTFFLPRYLLSGFSGRERCRTIQFSHHGSHHPSRVLQQWDSHGIRGRSAECSDGSNQWCCWDSMCSAVIPELLVWLIHVIHIFQNLSNYKLYIFIF